MTLNDLFTALEEIYYANNDMEVVVEAGGDGAVHSGALRSIHVHQPTVYGKPQGNPVLMISTEDQP